MASELKEFKKYGSDFQLMQRELLVDSDHANGIVSTFEKLPSGKVILERKVPKNPEERIAPDKNPQLIRNNTLLRALGTFRGVKHVLSSLSSGPQKSAAKSASEDINRKFEKFYQKVNKEFALKRPLEELQENLKALEQGFNLSLLKALNKPGLKLLEGIETKPKKLNQFLCYCRYAAGSLDPAPIVRTISQIGGRTYTETCYPLTQKTESQIGKLKDAIPADPALEGTSFYKAMSPAIKLVTRAFRSKFLDQNCSMSPQMRLYIPYGLKQGFAVQRQLSGTNDIEPQSVWSSRAGTLAYVGKGEAKSTEAAMEGRGQVEKVAEENLEQLRENLKVVIDEHGTEKEIEKAKNPIHIHVSMLNTDWHDGNRQDLMVQTTEVAIRKPKESKESKDAFSYTPVNILGRVWEAARLDSRYVSEKFSGQGPGISPRPRIELAARIGVNNIVDQHDADGFVISHGTCASGCDRTGTRELLVSKMWLEELGLPPEKIMPQLAAAGHNVTMSHILCPGSPGLKTDSRPGNLFGKHNERTYLESANFNKKAAMGDVASKSKKIRKIGFYLLVATLILVGLMLIAHYVLPLLISNFIFFAELSAVFALPLMGALSAGFILALAGVGILVGLIRLFHSKQKDWLVSIVSGVIAAGAIVGIIALAPLLGIGSLFALTWGVLATSTLTVPFIFASLLVIFMLIAVAKLAARSADKAAKKEFCLEVQQGSEPGSDSENDESVIYDEVSTPTVVEDSAFKLDPTLVQTPRVDSDSASASVLASTSAASTPTAEADTGSALVSTSAAPTLGTVVNSTPTVEAIHSEDRPIIVVSLPSAMVNAVVTQPAIQPEPSPDIDTSRVSTGPS